MSEEQVKPLQEEAGGRAMEKILQQQLTDIAKQLSESHITMTQMSSKIDHLETILNMKVDSNKLELEHQINDLVKEVDELRRYREKHTDEHILEAKEKNKMTWGLIGTACIAFIGMVIEIGQRIGG